MIIICKLNIAFVHLTRLIATTMALIPNVIFDRSKEKVILIRISGLPTDNYLLLLHKSLPIRQVIRCPRSASAAIAGPVRAKHIGGDSVGLLRSGKVSPGHL